MTQQKISETISAFIAGVKKVGFDKVQQAADDEHAIGSGWSSAKGKVQRYPELQNVMPNNSFFGLCIGGVPMVSNTVRYELTKQIQYEFLKDHPFDVICILSDAITAITYYNCSDYQHALLHRTLADPKAAYAQLAAEGAMILKEQNSEHEALYWGDFLKLVPNKEQLEKFADQIPDVTLPGYSSSLRKSLEYKKSHYKEYILVDDYYSAYVQNCPRFDEQIKAELQLLNELFPKEIRKDVTNPPFVLGESFEHKKLPKIGKSKSFDQTVKMTREKLCQYPGWSNAHLASELDESERNSEEQILSLKPLLCARALFLTENFKGNFIYRGLTNLKTADCIETHYEDNDQNLMMYLHQQMIDIGEKNIDLDIQAIQAQTSYLQSLGN
jgi:hypothetical protein